MGFWARTLLDPSMQLRTKSQELLLRTKTRISRIHPALQDQDGCHAVHGASAFFYREIKLAEEAVGLAGAEPLVPEVDGQGELFAQVFGEELHFFGLNSFGSAQAQGVSDDDLGDFVLADDRFEAREVCTLILAADGFEALRSDSERIGDGEADGS